MSEAENLLDTVTEGGTSGGTAGAGSLENHIVIGPGDGTVGLGRVITVPEALKKIAVQYDHNIETVTFDCPRYWDEHDMSKMAVYVNYMKPNGDIGTQICSAPVVDDTNENVMHFNWTITKDATMYHGSLKFLVCIKKTDEEGNSSNHWNSELNTEMYISEGLEIGDITEDEKYHDVITELLLRMDAVEAIPVPEVTVTETEKGYHIVLTDANSSQEIDVNHGDTFEIVRLA